jgi:mercuric ion transport protein
MHPSQLARQVRYPWQRVAPRGYLVLVCLFVLCVLLQVFLAGVSIFVSASWWEIHKRFGESFGALTILLLLLCIAMRPKRSVIWLTGLLVVLYSLQYLFIELAGRLSIPWLSALHPVNALVIFWLAVTLGRSVFQQGGQRGERKEGEATRTTA